MPIEMKVSIKTWAHGEPTLEIIGTDNVGHAFGKAISFPKEGVDIEVLRRFMVEVEYEALYPLPFPTHIKDETQAKPALGEPDVPHFESFVTKEDLDSMQKHRNGPLRNWSPSIHRDPGEGK